MKETRNLATNLRPEGARVLDAPFLKMDLNEFASQIRDEKTWKNSDRNAITVFKTKGMCIVLIALHQNATIPTHATEGIISVHVLEGEINFNAEGRTETLSEGMMVTLYKGIEHSVFALKKSVFLLTIAG